jgi:hypothetical protein
MSSCCFTAESGLRVASSGNSKNSCLGDDVYEYSGHGSTFTNVVAAQQPPGVLSVVAAAARAAIG